MLSSVIATLPLFAQGQLLLGAKYSGGQTSLSFKGDIGSVYSIQSATGLSKSDEWTNRTLIQVQGTNDVWDDLSSPSLTLRFYRALAVSGPNDPNFVFIQPGTFIMGSPPNEAGRTPDEAQHFVTISRGFWIGKYLVTQGDYLSIVGSNPSYFTGDATRPVEMVSWNDATNYCALRTTQELTAGLISTNYAYRLPTESEWEYADRSGTATAFYLGSGLHSGQANFIGQDEYDASVGTISNPSGVWLGTTTSVGSYAPHAWGLYDMIGNVRELCQDGYGPYPTGDVIDPQGVPSAPFRVLRGGDWRNDAQHCRSAQRSHGPPTGRVNYVGFRVVLVLSQ